MSETAEIVHPALEALNAMPGVVAYRIHSGKVAAKRGGWIHLGPSGQADIGVCVRGRCLFLEAKTAKGLVSEEQLAWHGRARRAGADVLVIRSVREAIDAVRAIKEMVAG